MFEENFKKVIRETVEELLDEKLARFQGIIERIEGIEDMIGNQLVSQKEAMKMLNVKHPHTLRRHLEEQGIECVYVNGMPKYSLKDLATHDRRDPIERGSQVSRVSVGQR